MLNRFAALLAFLVAISGSTAPMVHGQESPPTRDDYLQFVRPFFLGTWRCEATTRDGAALPAGTIEFQMNERQRCAVSVASPDDSAPVDTAIHGYDPGAKCWRVVQFSGDGSMLSMEVRIDKKTLTGGKYEGATYTHRNTLTTSDGTKYVSDWKARIVDRNTLELQQVSGEANGPVKLRFVRK